MSDQDMHKRFEDIFGNNTDPDDSISPEVARRAANMKPNRLVKVREYDPEYGWITEYVAENELVDAPAKPAKKTITKLAAKSTYQSFPKSWQPQTIWGNFLINWKSTCNRNETSLVEAIANSIIL